MSETLPSPGRAASSKAEDPTWVFLPGITGQNTALRAVCDTDRHLILDLPPVSFSDSAARRIARQLQDSDVGHFIVIGYSYGALVALRLASLLRDDCRGVVLVNPPRVGRDSWRRYGTPLWELVRNFSLLLPARREAPSGIVSSRDLEAAWEADSGALAAQREAIKGVIRSAPRVAVRAIEALVWDACEAISQCCANAMILTDMTDICAWHIESPNVQVERIHATTYFPLVSDLSACVEIIKRWITGLNEERPNAAHTSELTGRIGGCCSRKGEADEATGRHL